MMDAARIRKAQSGDETAMSQLLSAVQERIYRTAFFILGNEVSALEATSELLIRVSRNIDSFDFHTSLDAWVTRLTSVYCVEKAGQRSGKSWLQLNGTGLSEGNMHSEFSKRLNRLPEDLRKMVVMRYVNGFTAAEIATLNGIAVSVIESALVQARIQLASAKSVPAADHGAVLSMSSRFPTDGNATPIAYPFHPPSTLSSDPIKKETDSEVPFAGPEVS